MHQQDVTVSDAHLDALRTIVRELKAILAQLKRMTASQNSSRQGLLAPGCVREHNMECGHE